VAEKNFHRGLHPLSPALSIIVDDYVRRAAYVAAYRCLDYALPIHSRAYEEMFLRGFIRTVDMSEGLCSASVVFSELSQYSSVWDESVRTAEYRIVKNACGKSIFVHISCIVWLPKMYHGDGSLNYGALSDFSTGSSH